MLKTDESFIKNNLKELINKAFENSKRLLEGAKILKEKQHFCSSLFLSISALEELAKWHFLKQDNVNFDNLEKITTHSFKIDEIVKIFKEITNNSQFKKEDSDWLKKYRILEMRQDVLYVRLRLRNNDKKYPIFPKEGYWQKRAKAMMNLLSIIYRNIK